MPPSDDIEIRELRKDDAPWVQALVEACHEFYALRGSTETSSAEARSLFTSVPPGAADDDKILLGAFLQLRLVGVLDLIARYPQRKEALIALLLIQPEHRGCGLGRSLVAAAREEAEAMSLDEIMVNIDPVDRVEPFWEALDFSLRDARSGRWGSRVRARS
ncbi:MAG TPA: GNAT family N-acetyltransferase [Candidatus Baltobacteraceae bacterium]